MFAIDKTKAAFALVGVSAFLLVHIPSANAQSSLELISGTNVVTVQGVGGVATYNGPIGSWNIDVTTGLAAPVAAPGTIDLNSVSVSAGGTTAPLYILWSSTGYSAGAYSAQAGGTLSPGNSVMFSSYYGALLSTNTPLTGPEAFANNPFSGVSGGVAVGTGPFAITEETEIIGAPSTTSVDQYSYTVQSVPEPAPAWLVAGGLGLGGIILIKRKSARVSP